MDEEHNNDARLRQEANALLGRGDLAQKSPPASPGQMLCLVFCQGMYFFNECLGEGRPAGGCFLFLIRQPTLAGPKNGLPMAEVVVFSGHERLDQTIPRECSIPISTRRPHPESIH